MAHHVALERPLTPLLVRGGGGGGVGTAPNPYQDSQELYWYTLSWSLCSIAMLAVGLVLGMGFSMYGG